MRKSGVLLAISSLPSEYGIGAFSKEAYAFVDFLKEAGQSLWQLLPLGPTSYGDSPYQSFSIFAGNPYFIDLEALTKKGWISKKDCEAWDFGTNPVSVDYAKMYKSRFQVLFQAYKNSNIGENQDFLEFEKRNEMWLEDYALYMAVKNAFGGKSWLEWDEDIRFRKQKALIAYRKKYAEEVEFYKFQQYLFDVQWQALKAYANKKGIEIVGDIPIYVALDSADVWAGAELFQLDEKGIPLAVAGCPPDAFSRTGQLWGNPLYDWTYHKKTGYAWWIQRIKACYRLYDILRIDHFRGFDEYYAIPYGDETAEFGHWEPGPGYEIFRAIKAELGKIRIIAEDLGFLTPSVIRLVKKTGYPGMKVLQFAFDSREESDYLPHNYTKNCVVYTGTHDNDTTLGWFESLSRPDKRFAKRYLDFGKNKEVCWELIRTALASVADTAVIPMQDYLELGAEARMNKPSTVGCNWKWRMLPDACTKELAQKMHDMVKLYARL